MQNRPDAATLLDAVCEFLLGEVASRVEDKALNFRVLIAANVASVVAGELRTADARVEEELAGLRTILPGESIPSAPTTAARAELVTRLNRVLAQRLRDNAFTAEQLPAVHAHVRAVLRSTLAYANPRFDTSERIE